LAARLRERLARKWIAGAGLEIGAGRWPLAVPPDVQVRYVDVRTREEIAAAHPELDAAAIVETDVVDDGTVLATVATGSQCFVIANHVLEHTVDPIGVLECWARVLAPDGVLFVTVPVASGCFDRGRVISTMEHLGADHAACEAGGGRLPDARHLCHYREWLRVSEPNILRERGEHAPRYTPPELERHAEELLQEKAEIHFHTFSRRSFRSLLTMICDGAGGALALREVRGNQREVVGIVQRWRGPEPARAAQ